MNKQRKTSHILNVFQYDADGHVILPASLTLSIAPASGDNNSKVPTTAWVRAFVSGLNYVTGNQSITVSGDATGSGTTSIALTLANTAVTPGTYGSTTLVPVVTVDSKGRITSVTTAAISGSLTFTGDITGTGTTGTSTGLTLAASGVTAGTYTKVTVDSKGRVTVGASATTSDISEGTNLYYTDARVLSYLSANTYATQSYVNTQVSNLVAAAPATLDTLNELAAALGNDPSFATTISTALGNRLRVDINNQGLSATLQGYGRTNLGLGTAATSNTGDFVAYRTFGTAANSAIGDFVAYRTFGTAANNNTGDFATAAQGTKADTAHGWGNHAVAGYLTTASAASTYVSLTGSYANPSWITSLAYSKITGVPAFLTSYTETDTLATVTARGATTGVDTIYTGGLKTRKSQTAGDYTTAALWVESHSNTATGIAFHISGVKGTYLEMRTNQVLYWDGNTVYHSGNLTNLNQLTNGPGYISSITSGNVTTALGYTPYNATNPNGYITGYTETDTLASVMGRGNTTASTITFNASYSQSSPFTFIKSTFAGGIYCGIQFVAYNPANSVDSSLGLQVMNGAGSYVELLRLNGSAGTVSVGGTINFTDSTNGIYKSGGRLTVRSESTDNVANFANYGLYLPVMGQTAGLYVESPIEAIGGLRMGSGAGNGTITVGADTGAGANRLVQRDAGGDTYVRYSFAVHFNQTGGNSENPTIGQIWTQSTTDNYVRKSTPAHFISQLGLITSSNIGSQSVATATTANNLAANTSPTIQVLNFTGVGTNSGNANQSYAIYQEGGAWSPPFPDLCIGYHTGIKLGAYFGYNGIRFFNNSDFATQTFSVNDGDNHVRVAYNLYVGGTISASNLSGTNTGDQTNISGNAATATNATTAVNALGLANSGAVGSLSSAGQVSGWDSRPGGNAAYSIGYHTGLSLHGYGGYGGVRLYSAGYPTLSNSVLRLEASDAVRTYGILYNDTSVRAPIYYDSDDTAYYLNPAGGSRLRNLYVGDSGDDWSDPGGWGTQVRFSNGPHVRFVLHARTPGIEAGMYVHTPGSVYIGSYTSHDVSLMYGGSRKMGFNASYIYTDVYLEAAGSVRAPLFYDSADTAYYLDPAGTSNLNKFSEFTMAYNGMNPMSANSPYVARYNGSSGYRNGTMGSGNTDFTTIFSSWGSGFIDTWSSPSNAPGGSSHYIGLQGIHYSIPGSTIYGFQMACAGEADNRFFWRSSWPSMRSWVEMIHTGNIGSQSVSYASTAGSAPANGGNSTTVGGVGIGNIVRKDTSGQYLRAYYEYGSYLTSETPVDLVNQGLAGGGLRVDFMHPSYTGSGNWNHVITWSGYNGYNMYQLGGNYDGGTGTDLWVRSEANHGRTSWTAWRKLLNSSNYNSYSPTLTGGGASGTWGISISGNAATASSASSASSAGSVTGASTMSGYLTVSADWSTSPYTSAFTIIGTYPSITLRNSTADWEFLMHSDGGGDLQYYFGPGYTVNNWVQRYTFGKTGNFEVRTGTITASGDITAYSDIRVKENIEVIENALEKVKAIRGVTFNRTDLENNKGARHTGVIAQEVLEVLPEVIKTNDKGIYSVAYGNMVGLLIEAIKEQQLQIEELKNKLDNVLSSR